MIITIKRKTYTPTGFGEVNDKLRAASVECIIAQSYTVHSNYLEVKISESETRYFPMVEIESFSASEDVQTLHD